MKQKDESFREQISIKPESANFYQHLFDMQMKDLTFYDELMVLSGGKVTNTPIRNQAKKLLAEINSRAKLLKAIDKMVFIEGAKSKKK